MKEIYTLIIITVVMMLILAACLKDNSSADSKKTVIATYYADSYEGRLTASGEKFRQDKFTAAARQIIPLERFVLVTNIKNNKSIVVWVNDRMSEKAKAGIDLSKKAFEQIADLKTGKIKVSVEILEK